jgi:tetratricopeptide (TPR) repeat protein
MASPPAAAPQAGSTLAKLPTTKVARIEASGNAQVSGKARPAAPLSPLAPQATSSVLTPIALPAPQVATSSTASGAVAGAAPGASPSAVTSTDAQAAQARQMQAGREALAQAQGLWNAGSHDAANELLQHALVLAERSASASPTPANSQLLATLAREQARMHIADGRAQAALDGLARLEPLLGQEADVWALRGNAAQRLGRHPESLRAYTTALQMRPNEQRWLLGAAVSMAALGQTANASEMAAKARAIGPVSKEVQSYLRQAGVTLIEP